MSLLLILKVLEFEPINVLLEYFLKMYEWHSKFFGLTHYFCKYVDIVIYTVLNSELWLFFFVARLFPGTYLSCLLIAV